MGSVQGVYAACNCIVAIYTAMHDHYHVSTLLVSFYAGIMMIMAISNWMSEGLDGVNDHIRVDTSYTCVCIFECSLPAPLVAARGHTGHMPYII